LEYFLYGLFFISCIILIASVLLQPGKTDAGALFTSNISSTAFGPRGTATVLSKITIVAATVFMLSALMLSMPALTGERSVLSTNPETPAETLSGTNTNANVDANANVSANIVVTNTDVNTPANNTATNTATQNTNAASNANANQ
jgi:protein translocase SecG subunit